MKVLLLGTGTSTGVPQLGCSCSVCKSDDIKDNRLRSSLLVTKDNEKLLIDCGPDFRQQMLLYGITKITDILFTHEHYDHVSGLDEVRPFREVNVFAEKRVLDMFVHNMPYVFNAKPYPGAPKIHLHEISDFNLLFKVASFDVQPIRMMHQRLPVLGYRIGKFAYITDFSVVDEAECDKLKGLDVLVMDALRISTHPAHLSLAEALELVKKLQPKKTYFIHMSHDMGLHEEVERTLPEGVFLAYDGLEIEIAD